MPNRIKLTTAEELKQKILDKKDLSKYDYSSIYDMSGLLSGCKELLEIPFINTINVTNMQGMFDGCERIRLIPNLDTTNVRNMENMFLNCCNLKSVLYLNTSRVTTMRGMFDGCLSLETIPQIDTSIVEDMDYMFYGCKNLKVLPRLNVSSTEKMSAMFGKVRNMNKELNVSFEGFGLKLKDMYQMFETDDIMVDCVDLDDILGLLLTQGNLNVFETRVIEQMDIIGRTEFIKPRVKKMLEKMFFHPF